MTWRDATEQALYGPGGFYRDGPGPGAHFRTSVHVSPRFAEALVTLLADVDAALGHPDRLDLVDVGAGRGELLTGMLAAAPPPMAARLRCVAVEMAARPDGLDPRIAWRAEPPAEVTGLAVANEWLDNVPVDVVEMTPDGPRVVLVDPFSGGERPGWPPPADDRDWLTRWWPLREPGGRAEVGRHRCAAWAGLVRGLRRGLALTADYGHVRGDRPTCGSLTGYRDGRLVPPVPDGRCDITAHVALDACAAAGRDAGADATAVTTQRAALRALGVTGARPPLDLARSDPRRYVHEISSASTEAELITTDGLGAFTWLAQSVGIGLPEALLDQSSDSGSGSAWRMRRE
jgi:SAM-dependent MidA family methyltransferase